MKQDAMCKAFQESGLLQDVYGFLQGSFFAFGKMLVCCGCRWTYVDFKDSNVESRILSGVPLRWPPKQDPKDKSSRSKVNSFECR